jgi:hypothetical protein
MMGAKSILLRVVGHGEDLQSYHDETPSVRTVITLCFYVNWWVSLVFIPRVARASGNEPIRLSL